MRKRKTVFLLLACLLLTLAAGCGKETQQPQERSRWDILSARCGEAECMVSVTKNWGGQETGLSCVVFTPPHGGHGHDRRPADTTAFQGRDAGRD